MNIYQIYSKDGMNMGQFEGAEEAEALANMHQDAGYDVTVDNNGLLIFATEDDEQMCGNVDAYEIVELEEEYIE